MAQAAAVVKAEERKIPQLVPTRMRVAEAVRQVHCVTVESADFPSDFVEPEFWSLVSKDMRPGDLVEVRDDSMTYFGLFYVMAADQTWAKVEPLFEKKLVPVSERQISPDYKVEYKGPHRKWCVLRISDKSAVHEGEPDRGAANVWLDGYVRTIGARLTKVA